MQSVKRVLSPRERVAGAIGITVAAAITLPFNALYVMWLMPRSFPAGVAAAEQLLAEVAPWPLVWVGTWIVASVVVIGVQIWGVVRSGAKRHPVKGIVWTIGFVEVGAFVATSPAAQVLEIGEWNEKIPGDEIWIASVLVGALCLAVAVVWSGLDLLRYDPPRL